MTDILKKIDEIIKRDFKVSAKGNAYRLEENSAQNYPVTTIKKHGKMLMYSFDTEDSNEAVFPIFNASEPRLTLIADYLVFYPKNDTLFVFVCNLKSTQTGNANKQAEASWQLSEYIVKTAQRMLDFNDFKVEYRSILFCLKNTSRFTSNSKSPPYTILENSKLKNIRLKAGENYYLDDFCV